MLPDTWSLAVDDETGVLVITIGSIEDFDTFVQNLTALDQSPVNRNSNKKLYDLRLLSPSRSLSSSEIRLLSSFSKRHPRSGLKSAYVANHDVHYGLLRMFEMITERPGIERRVFRDYDEAWDWLLTPEPPAVLD